MEQTSGVIFEGEWNGFAMGGMYSSSHNEEADFMAQLFNCSFPSSSSNELSMCLSNSSFANPSYHEGYYYPNERRELEMPRPEDTKKRSNHFGDVQQNRKSSKQRKKRKGESPNMVESNSNSGDESNVSYEGVTSSSVTITKSAATGKTRVGRGSATDPQSVYARKRRERINERLRILQTLVPNGTKVDISTMLEEAVQYVKFLQNQIKLLSSNDMWMYAPIAYNGMDIGLDLIISSPNKS